LHIYWSHTPTGADVLALGKQGSRLRLVHLLTPPQRRSARCHQLEHVADLESPAACQHHECDTQAWAAKLTLGFLLAIVEDDDNRAASCARAWPAFPQLNKQFENT